jgi:hypothetical protein
MAQPPSPAHPLTFRVMRLTAATPSRRPTLPFVCTLPEAADAGDAPDAFLRGAPSCEAEGAPGSVGTVCVLPASFGSIYASETFRSFISTYNFSDHPVHAVAVSIEIQTSSQARISLVTTRTAANLPSRDAVSHVVSSTLPELGVHVLICSASYMDRSGTPRTLRQLFRFNVLPPLEPFVNVVALHRRRSTASQDSGASVATSPASPSSRRVPPAGTPMAQFLVDLRVLNTMPVPVYFTSARLDAGPAYTVVSSLIRPDDPAAPPEAIVRAGFGSVGDGSATASQTGEAGDGPYRATEDGGRTGLPPRGASTGVGDTRNFLFYAARPLEPHELPSIQTPTSPTPATCVPRSASETSGPQSADAALDGYSHVTEASPAPSAAVPRRDATAALASAGTGADSEPSAAAPAPKCREIGCFSLQWRSGSGEQGQMENVIAAFEPAARSADIDLVVAAVPQDIRVQTPFAARCIARNNSSKAVRLYLQVRRDLVGEIVPVGISGISLGEVGPETTAECLLPLIALTRGQHSISGVRVVDIDSRQSFCAEAPVVSVL